MNLLVSNGSQALDPYQTIYPTTRRGSVGKDWQMKYTFNELLKIQ